VLISSLFSRGLASGELRMEDPKEVTEVFLDAVSGIHFNKMTREKHIFPGKEQFKSIFAKEKLLAEIFLTGLKA